MSLSAVSWARIPNSNSRSLSAWLPLPIRNSCYGRTQQKIWDQCQHDGYNHGLSGVSHLQRDDLINHVQKQRGEKDSGDVLPSLPEQVTPLVWIEGQRP